jgi:hypothetical protein
MMSCTAGWKNSLMRSFLRQSRWRWVLPISVVLALVIEGEGFAAEDKAAALSAPTRFHKKINFIDPRSEKPSPNPPGWEAYDGAVYTKERGYGWLPEVPDEPFDVGPDAEMILNDGTRASPKALGRLELANGQGAHPDNRPFVFRVDLPDGWYRVRCASAFPINVPLPLVDQRSFKCRAQDVVFAGSSYGAPLKVEGDRLVEGSGVVEVTQGHLRIVVGDPAYGGWTWSHPGPIWRGWKSWLNWNISFAKTRYQKIARFVDPGFHGLRFNALEIEQAPAPVKRPALVFRDFFNRDDNTDINAGLAKADHWIRAPLGASDADRLGVELYKTSLRIEGPKQGKGVMGLVQPKPAPANGIVRYSTRVSLFTGEGSRIGSGIQEAGLLILGEPRGTNDFNSTFIGVAYDRSRGDSPGHVRYRVGDGQNGYRTNSDIPDTKLPFKITEGEYEITAEHDVARNLLSRVQINGIDVTSRWTPSDRKQRIPRGLFGIRAAMDPHGSGVRLQQFYWFYRVETISSRREG